MIPKEAIEIAYSFLHQKRNVYIHSTLDWQKDDIEYAIASYVDEQLGFLPLLVSGIPVYSAEEMADEECRYVVFPEYGWGWSLLTTPERLYGKDACSVDCSPEESYRLMNDHLHAIIPHASDKQISKLLR